MKNSKNIEQAVTTWIKEQIDDAGHANAQSVIDELLSYGCQSGIVSDLIYYCDTCAFFEAHKKEINDLLGGTLDECGIDCPSDLFGDKWNIEDPLAEETSNQNLLAWFGFETVASRLDPSDIETDDDEEIAA